MAQIEARQDVRVKQKLVGVQETQRLGLHRPAEKKRLFLEAVRHVRHDHFADVFSAGAIQHQPHRALRVVLTDQHHGPMEERAPQFAAVEKQLSFQRFEFFCHVIFLERQFAQACFADNPD